MSEGFDLNKVYVKEMNKEELLGYIQRTYDKEFQVIFLPTSKNSADILIRDSNPSKSETEGKK